MGKNKETVEVLWDTGSEWLTIESYLCSTCDGGYDYSPSLGDTFTVKPNSEGERNYGSASTSGFEAYETVCIKTIDEACTSAFNMFIVTKQDGMPGYADGIAGLSTSAKRRKNKPEHSTIVKAWADAGITTNARFAFALNDL